MRLLAEAISTLATPLTVALLFGLSGGILFILKVRRTACVLLIAAAAVVYFGALGMTGNALLGPLERAFPPLVSLARVDHVVVLASGYRPRDGLPVTAALDEDGLVRIVEAVRLARMNAELRLVLCGGRRGGYAPPAEGYAELARALGVDPDVLVLLDQTTNTASEAQAVRRLLEDTPFILVTSAYHMPRAVRLLKNLGARPIPAPTGHRVEQERELGWRSFLPSADGLRKTERALHEYLGLMAIAFSAS